MKQKVFNILISLVVGVLVVVQVLPYLKEDEPPEIKVVYVVSEEQPNFFSKSPQEGLMEALEYYGVKHPQIVYAQAILESNLGKSPVYKRTNNLFGLYDSVKREYFTYNHWSDGVLHYKIVIQSKLKEGEDYYSFLERIKYAEDPDYINKLKGIVSRNDKRRDT